ncbi:MAG: NAD-binding protein [Candidatus Thermoplasmatota archaeon]|nr:NAD-binding protein [Candidatus Thermoplasmatota archaeon]MBU4256275.1 NAD-binding protein [Candidatus Thermoplasmatota archaeon]MCG2825219.1 NAD-binding protein [Thermoplasmatales archaeon]
MDNRLDIMKIVVVGMGYVGIPVAAEFANHGFDVVGINRSKWKVDWITGKKKRLLRNC